MIADETKRERELYARVKDAERAMEPYKKRMEAVRSEWSEAYNKVKTLKQVRELLVAQATENGADVAVLDADQRELAASEPRANP